MRAKPKRNFMKDATPNRKALEGPGEGWAGLPYGSSSTSCLSTHRATWRPSTLPHTEEAQTQLCHLPKAAGGGGGYPSTRTPRAQEGREHTQEDTRRGHAWQPEP